jgi:protein-L-isoaspartate(D-aspartate) O-methyltransferase
MPTFPARSAVQRGVQAAWPKGPAAAVSPQAHLQMARQDARHGSAQPPAKESVAAPPRWRPAPPARRADAGDARSHMVDRLRTHAGIADERVLQALRRVDRHRFIDAALGAQAYEDTSLPIGHGQTISKPSVVARMIELLMQGEAARALNGLGRTLEIGTGCGYQAAVLCQLASDVYSVERLAALHDLARENLRERRPRHLRLVYGDGMLGHPPNAPYVSIVSAAGGAELPGAWLDQLAVGGRLVAPVAAGAGGGQALRVVDRTPTGYQERSLEAVHFVPLKSGAS